MNLFACLHIFRVFFKNLKRLERHFSTFFNIYVKTQFFFVQLYIIEWEEK